MRRHPLVLVAVVVGIVIYGLARELGHVVALAALRLPLAITRERGWLPTVWVGQGAGHVRTETLGWVIAAGPIASLAVGYLLLALVAKRGRALPSFPRMVIGFVCYITLIIDPIYYAVIPMLNLGGDPGTLATLLGISSVKVQLAALIVLVVNIVLTRNLIVPLVRGKEQERAQTGSQEGPRDTSAPPASPTDSDTDPADL